MVVAVLPITLKTICRYNCSAGGKATPAFAHGLEAVRSYNGSHRISHIHTPVAARSPQLPVG